MTKPGRIGRFLRSERGQAMVEYSIITYALLGLGIIIAGAPMPGLGGQSLTTKLIESLNVYHNSLYFILNTPFP